MKWLGYKRFAFKSIKMDVADIRRRAKEKHVTDLAANIREHGDEPIHAPTIRAGAKQLLCGRDRMAALLILKAKRLWVRLAECTDLEAADLEASENIHRRPDNPNEVIAKAVAIKERLLSANESGQPSRPKTDRYQDSTKAVARKLVARDHGMTVAAVKKREQRYEDEREKSSTGDAVLFGAAPVEVEEAPPTLNLLGCDDASTRAVMKFARPVQAAIDEADKHLRLALGALKPLDATDIGQDLRKQVERVGALVRSHRPESICPWCKGLPKATVGNCGGCGGAGYVSAEKVQRAPSECFFREPPLVIVKGKAQPYADVRDGKVKPGVNGAAVIGKPARTISVVAVDDDGNETPQAID